MSDSPSKMKVKGLAPWYGSKRVLAPKIIAELGEHSAYWEPFCGSMSVLFAKHVCPMETVNDLHRDLINLARVMASDHYIKLAERLNRTLMADELFLEAKQHLDVELEPAPSIADITQEHVWRAYWYFIASWQGRNGVGGTLASNITVATRYTSQGGSGGFRWQSAVDSVPAWHERLRAVHIKNMDGFGMLRRIEDSGRSAIYIDPPYFQKSDAYVHDFSAEDHQRLSEVLQRYQETRVVVSYYDNPILEDLYPAERWTKRSVPVAKGLVNQGRRDARDEVVKAPEVLLLNGPSYAGGKGAGLFPAADPKGETA